MYGIFVPLIMRSEIMCVISDMVITPLSKQWLLPYLSQEHQDHPKSLWDQTSLLPLPFLLLTDHMFLQMNLSR